jgi:ketosteroid isomerase-like protein
MQKTLILAAMLAVSAHLAAVAQPVINAPFGEPADETMVEFDPRSIVEQYAGAFNARDVDRMESLMHPGIQIMEVTASGTDMVSEGYWAIVSHWLEHIEDEDTPVLELTGWSQVDDYVTAIETSRQTGPDGTPNEARRLTVYQVTDDGAIRRIWYYPPVEAE